MDGFPSAYEVKADVAKIIDLLLLPLTAVNLHFLRRFICDKLVGQLCLMIFSISYFILNTGNVNNKSGYCHKTMDHFFVSQLYKCKTVLFRLHSLKQVFAIL